MDRRSTHEGCLEKRSRTTDGHGPSDTVLAMGSNDRRREKPETVRGSTSGPIAIADPVSPPDDAFLDEALPTMIDPSVPTGARDDFGGDTFDPHARVRAATNGERVDPREVIQRVQQAGPATPVLAAPRERVMPGAHAPVDDSARTAKWAPPAQPELQVVSRKAADAAAGKLAPSGPREKTAPVPKVRALSEVSDTPARGMGRLAPPRDAREVRSRRVRDVVIWCAAAAGVATVVTTLIWYLAA